MISPLKVILNGFKTIITDYPVLTPIKIIIMDFPRVLYSTIYAGISDIAAHAKNKQKVIGRASTSIMLDANAVAKTKIKSFVSMRLALPVHITGKMVLKGTSDTAFSLNSVATNKEKIKGKSTVNNPSIALNATLNPSKYYIGYFYRLRDWDDITLGDMDDLKMFDIVYTET